MRFSKTGLFLAVIVCMSGRAYSAAAAGALGGACLGTRLCTDETNHVCDLTTKLCKVKADNSTTDCADDNAKCPTNAACLGTGATEGKCACNTGYSEASGLCTVVGTNAITCSSDTDCTSKMANTECAITSPCTKGNCQCKTGYSGDVCQLLGNGKTCDTALSLCADGLHFECSSGACACKSGKTYKDAVGICTDKKLFGETCAATADCLATSNAECPSTGTKVCSCVSGYIQETGTGTQTCRLPYRTETCVYGVYCGKVNIRGLLTSESSQVDATCSATSTDAPGTCGCATSGQTMESAKKGATCYNYCLTTHTGTTTADSQACTTHSQCSSKVCAQCPGDTAGKCYSAPCSNGSGMKKTERGMIVLSFILLLAFIF